MKKQFKLENLDCANCAAKMESGIRNIEGITKANVSFMTQKLTIEADEGRFPEILAQAEQIIRKIEPDCKIIR